MSLQILEIASGWRR